MFDPNATLEFLAVAMVVLASATLVLSRIIPDDYDQRAPARRRINPTPRRHR